jgi:hypothetical protein
MSSLIAFACPVFASLLPLPYHVDTRLLTKVTSIARLTLPCNRQYRVLGALILCAHKSHVRKFSFIIYTGAYVYICRESFAER